MICKRSQSPVRQHRCFDSVSTDTGSVNYSQWCPSRPVQSIHAGGRERSVSFQSFLADAGTFAKDDPSIIFLFVNGIGSRVIKSCVATPFMKTNGPHFPTTQKGYENARRTYFKHNPYKTYPMYRRKMFLWLFSDFSD